MAVAAGWTTGLSSGCGGAPSMRTFICKTMATGWRRDADWAGGLTATTGNDRTRRWAMPRRRTRILIPAHTEGKSEFRKPDSLFPNRTQQFAVKRNLDTRRG